jgi:hypothetical protein
LALLIGGLVGIGVSAFFFVTLGDMEENGGRLRIPAIGWVIYGIGGKSLLSLVVGAIAGVFAWGLTTFRNASK